MDLIINEKNYQAAKTFIQNIITFDLLSDISKNKIVSLYNSITPENAQDILSEVKFIYNEDLYKITCEIASEYFKFSAISFLFSGTVNFGTYIGLKYYPESSILKDLRIYSSIVIGMSTLVLFSTYQTVF